MGNKRIIKYIVNSLLVILLLAAVVILNVAVQNNTTSSDETRLKTERQTKLNVAIVNEDKAVTVDDREYNLGASYVKNIERDDSQNWYIVTRGAADAGLEKGRYQLVLTIPTDFSEKVLDVNSINADKTTVTYKVNAGGNLQVENDANKLAKDIIADLNSQLVDMYMASILSNLYTAQQNVQASSEVQAANIGSYRTNLLDSAINSRNLFPTLFSMSTSSVDANNALKTTLESYAQVFDSLDNGQSAYNDNFGTLVKQRGEDQISYAAFMDQLMQMNTQYLDSETQKLYDRMQATQASITSQLGETVQNGNNDTDNLTKQVADLEAALQAERGKLDSHKEAIREFVANKLAAYYGVGVGQGVSLGQVYDRAGSEQLQKAEDALRAQLAAAVAELPAEDFSGQYFNNFGVSVDIPNLDYNAARQFGQPRDLGTTSAYLRSLVDQSASAGGATGQSGATARVSWQAPAGVTVNSVSYAGNAVADGQEITLVENGSFEVSYSVDNDTAASITNASVAISLNGVQTVSASVDVQASQRNAAEYGKQVQRIASSYSRVQSLLDAYYSLQELKNGDLSAVLTDLLVDAIQTNLDSYQSSLSQGSNGQQNQGVQQNLDLSIEQLKAKIEEIRASNVNLSNDISEQLALYDNLKTRLGEIATAQTASTAAQTKTDADLSALGSEFTSLLSATSGVKASSQSNIQAAESVNQIFSGFNRELANAQGSTEKLSSDAETLMGQFNEELANNGNFVASFVKVLNNAYENGVPNEVLLSFLSSPVAQTSSSVGATVNVYRPFTWILLLEIVSLFTAYLFATQNVIAKVKDKFKLSKLQDSDLTTVGVLSFLALAIGLVIGTVSSIQLAVGREYVPSWVLLMVGASFVLIQGQYLLLKHARVIGMGLAFFMIVSFVYLSNAIGTTASLTGFPAFIKNLNVLSVLESLLSGYFDGQTAGFFVFFALIIVLGLLMAANVFIKPKAIQTEKV